jgi:hypothetical protein
VAGTCECGNEPLGSLKCGEFLYWLKTGQLPKKGSYRENPNMMQQFIKILLFLILNKAQHVSGDTPPVIRSLQLHKQHLILHKWEVVGRAGVGRCQVAYERVLWVAYATHSKLKPVPTLPR